ncbi:MAG: class I SAM-dependent methyltransferase [Kiritimatiellae bacterium]|jgi:tellurite methyltransferase|nr:class I SAM-dependent methyltransferase [Kiritimatiellia bacterium]
MISEKNYWDEFYRKHRKNNIPSSFAEYVTEKYLQAGKTLLELGCGNGRDSLFMASNGVSIAALDMVAGEIEYLNSLNVKNVEFVLRDFTNLSGFSNFDYVYSRFTFHSIDEICEDVVLSQLSDVLKPGGVFLLEARSTLDEGLNKVYGETHFRRYLNFSETVKKIECLGFNILEKQESQGLAIYKDEDPFVLRVVAQKRS